MTLFGLLAGILALTTAALATDAELYQVTHLLAQFDPIADLVQRETGNLPPCAIDPVVTSVGEFILELIDRDLGGVHRFGFARYHGTFVSQAAQFWGFTSQPLGKNWTHNYHFLIRRVSATEVIVYYNKGKVLLFEKISGVWQFSPNLFGAVTYRGTPYQMIEVGSKLEVMEPETRRILTFEFTSLADGEVRGVEAIRDRNGNTHTLTYNLDGTLSGVVDGLGRSLSFEYVLNNGQPRISRVIDQSGRAVDYGYTSGSLTSVTNANGGTTLYGNDNAGRILSITEPGGNVVLQNTYQFNGRVKTQADGLGNVFTFTYGANATTIVDPLGNSRVHRFANFRMTRFTDEAGKSIDYTYDGADRLISTTDRMGSVSTVSYHAPSGYVQSRTDNLGRTWSYTYEAQLQEGFTFYVLVRIDYPDGTAVTMGRDAQGNLTAITDGVGNTTSYTRNGRGQVDSVTNAAGGVSLLTYNADGTLASRQDPSGNVTTFDYDALKRLVRVHLPDFSMMSVSYDANDNALSVTDENGNMAVAIYDANDNLQSMMDPLGHVTSFAYDANDDLVQVTDPLGQTMGWTYDAMRRVSQRTDRLGQVVSLGYDTRRRLVQFQDEQGQIWSFSHDDEGILSSLVDPLGQTWSVESDAQGQITKVTDPLGNETAYLYDALSRLIAVIDPLGRTTSSIRDANGLVSQVSLADPSVSGSYVRNGLRQITGSTDPRGNLWSSAFDAQGRRVSRSDPLGNQHNYTHDTRNRISQVTLPGGLGTVDLTYDMASRLTQRTYSDGTSFNYTYDASDRLTAANGLALAYDQRDDIVTCNGLSMTYDADGRMSSITFEPGKTVTYTYDARDQLQSITDWAGGTTSFTHDASGRLTEITHSNAVVSTFSHDGADRLVGVRETHLGNELSNVVLTRDGDGQIIEAVRAVPLPPSPESASGPDTYDAANQVASESYDAAGRLTHDGTRTFTWNLADQLQSYSDGMTTVSFTRDALGSLLSRTEGANSRELVWNYALGLPSIAIERDAGIAVRYYVHTPGGRLLYSIAADGSRLVYHFDEMGNTLFLTDGTAQIVQRYAYSPYGEIVAEGTGAGAGAVENWFTYHGAFGVLREQAAGSPFLLYSMRARYYDPVRARFLSRDPIELLGPRSLNPYQALFQNPLRFIDPLGTDPEDLTKLTDGQLQEELRRVEQELEDFEEEVRREKAETGFFAKLHLGLGVLLRGRDSALERRVASNAARRKELRERQRAIEREIRDRPLRAIQAATDQKIQEIEALIEDMDREVAQADQLRKQRNSGRAEARGDRVELAKFFLPFAKQLLGEELDAPALLIPGFGLSVKPPPFPASTPPNEREAAVDPDLSRQCLTKPGVRLGPDEEPGIDNTIN